jgi:haloalkane dehalogenase
MVNVANMFIKKLLPDMILRKLTKEEMDYYSAPYKTIRSRKPLLAWPKSVPFDGGKPKAVAKAVSSWSKWLTVTDIPKLCFYVSPGVAIKEKDVKIIRESMKNLKMIDLGEGLHFIQEDYPHQIGENLAEWYAQVENVVQNAATEL